MVRTILLFDFWNSSQHIFHKRFYLKIEIIKKSYEVKIDDLSKQIDSYKTEIDVIY